MSRHKGDSKEKLFLSRPSCPSFRKEEYGSIAPRGTNMSIDNLASNELIEMFRGKVKDLKRNLQFMSK